MIALPWAGQLHAKSLPVPPPDVLPEVRILRVSEPAAPLLSVVIPSRNRSRRLLTAIRSVQRQAGNAAEIIVVDDFSSIDMTATYSLLEGLGVRVLRLPEKRSGSFARNVGVEAARASHVSFLDSDDVWLPGLFDRIRTFAGGPGNRIMCAGIMLKTGDGLAAFHQPEWPGNGSPVDFIYRDGGRIQTSMLTLPTALARRHPFRPELPVNQDSDFAIRLWRAGVGFRIDTVPGIVKDESDAADRLTLNPDLVDRSMDWFEAVRADWSPEAVRGYYLRDRVWRLANSGRRPEAFRALAIGSLPPVAICESIRLGVNLILGHDGYARLRRAVRSIRPDRKLLGADPAGDWLRSLDDEVREMLGMAPARTEPRRTPLGDMRTEG
ncbi:glycosyltransferase family 2 protein [Cereibacter sp. SYSU M97828]|nr:glycosyltransferase family 2 protein [Cereibacter flavus]